MGVSVRADPRTALPVHLLVDARPAVAAWNAPRFPALQPADPKQPEDLGEGGDCEPRSQGLGSPFDDGAASGAP